MTPIEILMFELLKQKKYRQSLLDKIDCDPEYAQYIPKEVFEEFDRKIKELENAVTDLKYATSRRIQFEVAVEKESKKGGE